MEKRKIIILDTNKNKSLNSQVLMREGYGITVADSLNDVKRIFSEESIDLIIVRPEQPELLNMFLTQFPPEINVLIVCQENLLARMIEHAAESACSFLLEPFTVKRYKEAVARAIEKARVIEERIRNKALTDLEQAYRMLANEGNDDGFFSIVVKMSHAGTKADYTSLIIKNEATGDYEVKSSIGVAKADYEKMCRLVMLKNEPLIIDSQCNDKGLFKQLTGAGISAVMSLPIVIRGETIGAINHIKLSDNSTFAKSDFKFVSILGWWAGITLENIHLFNKVETQTAHVETLLQEILSAQQNERKRVAIEIHDGVAQWMVGASFGIKACNILIAESRFVELQTELDKIRETMQKSVRELRRAIADLRPIPLDEIGLVPAICQTMECLSQEGIKCHLETDEELPNISLAEETAIYWIVQESISNIRKHSSAREAEIKIKSYGNELKIEINDNGNGFNPDSTLSSNLTLEHMGLVGMQERAKLIGGTIKVGSTPGLGTNIILNIPVQSKQVTKTIYQGRTEYGQVT